MARKDVDPQFLFQLNDRLGHPWLGGVQGLGGFGQIEVAARGLLNKSELVQIHIRCGLKSRIIMLHLSKEVVWLPKCRKQSRPSVLSFVCLHRLHPAP